jgi:hypothetical protein
MSYARHGIPAVYFSTLPHEETPGDWIAGRFFV